MPYFCLLAIISVCSTKTITDYTVCNSIKKQLFTNMGRIDIFTIIIVAVCMALAAVLIFIGINKFRDNSNDLTATNSIDDIYEEIERKDDITPIPSTDSFYYDPETGETINLYQDEVETNFLGEDEGSSRNVTTVTPKAPATNNTSTRTYSNSGAFMVLAGSFSVRANADNQVSKLKRLGYSNARVEPFDRGAYAVVLVDRFDRESEARALVKELKSDHRIESYVKRKE